MSSKKRRNAKAKPVESEEDAIPEDEQWRLINDSGVLHQIPGQHAASDEQPEDDPLSGPIWDAIILGIPFCFLYMMMDILILLQYRQKPTFTGELSKMATAVPILGLFIYHTNRRKGKLWMQFLLFAAGTASGSRLIFALNKSNWLVVMQQAPPLATIWVYTVVQLRLDLALASLAGVYGFVWWKGLKLSV